MNFHEWTDENGEVLILRRIPKDRKTHGGFVWPEGIGTVVTAPDWNDRNECGGGLHGWPWGFGLGDGCDYDIIGDVWLVVGAKPEDVVGEIQGGAKCKARQVTIRMEGSFADAMRKVQNGFVACTHEIAKEKGNNWKSTVAGNNGQSTVAGDNGKSTVAGYNGQSTVAGYNGQSTVAGDNGKSTVAGDNGRCEIDGRNGCAAIAGTGRVKVGPRGAFAAAYWTDADGWRFLTGKVGEDGIEADTWYEIVDGKWQKVRDESEGA